jgi:hypothetical protein
VSFLPNNPDNFYTEDEPEPQQWRPLPNHPPGITLCTVVPSEY